MIQAWCVKQQLKGCETLIILWLCYRAAAQLQLCPGTVLKIPVGKCCSSHLQCPDPWKLWGASLVETGRERAAAFLPPYVLQVTGPTRGRGPALRAYNHEASLHSNWCCWHPLDSLD